MTFNIIVFYKNYQEPYKWSDYIDTVQNIANDSNGEKFIIEYGSKHFSKQYFSQMGFVYAGKWDEVESAANIIYYLYDSKNITNMNLEIISSNGIYKVYKDYKK